MPEQRCEVTTYAVDYICDQCNKGMLEPSDNIMLTCDPPLFNHKCNNCGLTRTFNERYPKIIHERVGA